MISDKQQYWNYRKLSAAEKKTLRELDRKKLVVAVHAAPDWPAKGQGKKRQAAAKTREQRELIMALQSRLFMMDHPVQRHKPVRKNCYYCQETKIYRDGVCAGHWQFLFENMNNRTRMKEKAYHRDMRAQERAKKREELTKQKAEV